MIEYIYIYIYIYIIYIFHIIYIIYIFQSAQWIQSNIIPDIGANTFFTTLSFMCYNHEVNDWESPPHVCGTWKLKLWKNLLLLYTHGIFVKSRTQLPKKIFQEKFCSYINWPNLFVWLSLLLEILGIMCIAIVCFPGFDIEKFEINLFFLIKLFLYKSRWKFKYLENKNNF